MANTVKLTNQQWVKIYNSIAQEFPHSYLLIREVQRRELGFNVRNHRYWDDDIGHWNSCICLDFYDDAKETWFRMKYL